MSNNIYGRFSLRFIMVLMIFLYRFLLDFSYIYFVSEVFGYGGFFTSINYSHYIISWILVFYSAIKTPLNIKKVSDYFFVLAIMSVLIPLSSYAGLSGRGIYPLLVTFFIFYLIRFFLAIKLTNKKGLNFVSFKNGKKLCLYISIFFIIITIAWYFLSGSVKYFNLNLSKVYDFRKESSELANVGIMSYINSWTYKVFALYALAWSLYKEKYFYAVLFLIVQVFLFGVTAHKSVLFSPVLILGVWWYFKKYNSSIVLPFTFCVVILLSLFVYYFFSDVLTPSIFIRRLFFVPAKLTFDYFDFFYKNDFVYWSNSILSSFIDYKYHLPVPLLIGDYEGSRASANNGFISSGYAHAGLFGVFLYAVIISILLRLLNFSVEKGIPLWFALAMVLVPLRDTLISSDLFTTLLTHGLFVAFVLLFFSIEKYKRVSYEK